jgi:predicted nucleotidyltransferase
MSKTLVDLLIERNKEQDKYFRNYLYYARLIKNEAKKILGQIRVIVFGSILKKDEAPQDIDILIISPELKTPEKKSEVRTEIYKKVGFATPFELHLITVQDYKNWYQNFIKEFVEV